MAEAPRQPRVGVVTGANELGSGAPRAMVELVCGVAGGDYAPVAYCGSPGDLARALVACGAQTVIARRDPLVGGEVQPYAALMRRGAARTRYAAQLVRSFREEDLDLVHLVGMPISSAALAASIVRRPVVWHVHEEAAYFRGPRAVRLVALRHLSRRVITPSTYVAGVLQDHGIPEAMLRVVPNGIDLDGFRAGHDPARAASARRELGLTDATPVVGIVAKLTRVKGIDLFLSMAARLGVQAQYLLVGDSDHPMDADYKGAIQRQAAAMDSSVRLVFAGHRSDISDMLALMDVCVMPTRGDAFGLVSVEAMAMERPVVATRVGGQPEIVADGKTGILVPAEDAHALAAAVERLLANPSERRHYGVAGLARARARFTTRAYADGVMAVWAEALS